MWFDMRPIGLRTPRSAKVLSSLGLEQQHKLLRILTDFTGARALTRSNAATPPSACSAGLKMEWTPISRISRAQHAASCGIKLQLWGNFVYLTSIIIYVVLVLCCCSSCQESICFVQRHSWRRRHNVRDECDGFSFFWKAKPCGPYSGRHARNISEVWLYVIVRSKSRLDSDWKSSVILKIGCRLWTFWWRRSKRILHGCLLCASECFGSSSELK